MKVPLTKTSAKQVFKGHTAVNYKITIFALTFYFDFHFPRQYLPICCKQNYCLSVLKEKYLGCFSLSFYPQPRTFDNFASLLDFNSLASFWKSLQMFFISVIFEFKIYFLPDSAIGEQVNISLKQWNKKTLLFNVDRSVLLENTPLVKFIQNYIWDLNGIFSKSSLVRILMKSFPAFLWLFVQTVSEKWQATDLSI